MTATQIRRLRVQKLGISQRQLARLVGVSPGAIGGWESGRLSLAAPYERILRVLEKTPEHRIRSKKWLAWLAAGATLAAFLFLASGRQKGR